MTQIQLYRSKVAGRRPTALADGRLFINQADGVLCWTDASGNLQTTPLAGLVQSASPQFTGTPQAPTAAPNDNSQRIATTAYVFAALAALIGNAPSALNTLKELADAINDDSNFAGTLTAALGNRLRVDAAQALSAGQQQQGLSNLGAQAALGFSAVQQGTGIGQHLANMVKLGWSGSVLKATVDNVDQGKVWTDSLVSQNFGANGYAALPNGLIVQWGQVTVTADTLIYFPATFPNGLFSVVASVAAGAQNGQLWSVGIDQYNVNAFAARPRLVTNGGTVSGASPAAPPGILWMALGH